MVVYFVASHIYAYLYALILLFTFLVVNFWGANCSTDSLSSVFGGICNIYFLVNFTGVYNFIYEILCHGVLSLFYIQVIPCHGCFLTRNRLIGSSVLVSHS